MRIFGIDPGSIRTGYGCVETDGTRHRLITCGALSGSPRAPLPERLRAIHDGLLSLLRSSAPACVVIENLFHARNVRSALMLGHARGVAVLAAVEAGLPVVEYTPAEIKVAVVGYGRAEKHQVQRMVTLLLALEAAPEPHDAADALAAAICHAHRQRPSDPGTLGPLDPGTLVPLSKRRSWRDVTLAELPKSASRNCQPPLERPVFRPADPGRPEGRPLRSGNFAMRSKRHAP